MEETLGNWFGYQTTVLIVVVSLAVFIITVAVYLVLKVTKDSILDIIFEIIFFISVVIFVVGCFKYLVEWSIVQNVCEKQILQVKKDYVCRGDTWMISIKNGKHYALRKIPHWNVSGKDSAWYALSERVKESERLFLYFCWRWLRW